MAGVLDDPIPRERADVDDEVTVTRATADRIALWGGRDVIDPLEDQERFRDAFLAPRWTLALVNVGQAVQDGWAGMGTVGTVLPVAFERARRDPDFRRALWLVHTSTTFTADLARWLVQTCGAQDGERDARPSHRRRSKSPRPPRR